MDNDGNMDSIARPNFLRRTDFFITFDGPSTLIGEHIQAFVGWFAATREIYPEIYVNGQAINRISYYDRPDVNEYSCGFFNKAWTFYVDVARYMTPDQGALKIEVLWNGQLVERKLYRAAANILPTDQRELVVFLHVPKSGGTSLRRALEEHAEALKMLAAYEDHGFFQTDDLYQISERALSHYDCIYGHFRFGIHKNHTRQFRYFSMIRNPYDLIISYYFYARSHLKDKSILNCKDIYEAVMTRSGVFVDNFLTRVFAGVDDAIPVDTHVYRTAIENIDRHFEFIGILENGRASFQRIGSYLGLDLKTMRENVNPYPHEFDLIDMAKFRAFVQPTIRYDLSLYEYVLQKYWGKGNAFATTTSATDVDASEPPLEATATV